MAADNKINFENISLGGFLPKNTEHGSGNTEHGSGNTEHGSGNTEHGSGNTEHGSGNTEHGSGGYFDLITPLFSRSTMRVYKLNTPEQCLTLETFIKNLPKNEELFQLKVCPGGYEVITEQKCNEVDGHDTAGGTTIKTSFNGNVMIWQKGSGNSHAFMN